MKKKSIVSIQTNDIEPENITKIKLILLKSLSNEQTILTLCKTEVYIAYENQEFQNIDLKGIFCIIASRINSNLFIQIYDCNDFNKQLEIELYTNIEYGLTIMNEKFLCIEFPTFFLGFNFTCENSLNEVYNCIIINSTILNSYSYQFNYEKKNNKKNYFKNSEIKFEKIEQLINFNYDDNNDIVYEISKGANRFLDTLDIGLADLNYEYEIIRTQIQNNKIEKKKIDEENKELKKENLIEKEKIEKIISELNKLEVVKKESDLEIIKKKNKLKKYKFNNNFYYEKKLIVNSNKLIMYNNDNENSVSSESEDEKNNKLKLKHISTSKKNKISNSNLNEELEIINKKNRKLQSSFALKNLNNK